MARMITTHLYNNPLETGLRALMILVESYPQPLDLQRLVVLDYLVLHSGDLPEGPDSIHPPSPLRMGEVVFRRQLIERGLHMFALRGLIAREVNEFGIRYLAEDAAGAFLDALHSTYTTALRDRAAWANEQAGSLTDEAAVDLLEQTIGRWRAEFSIEPVEGNHE